MSSDLVTFVRARLDDDEQAATQCQERSWSFSGSNCHVIAEQAANGSFRTVAWCANGYDDDLSNSIHIANYDPARVLREVEAKRRIVAIHNRRADVYPDTAGGTFENCCQGCGFEGVCEDPVVENVNDCPELKALAAVWSDHPDFRAEWAP